MLLKRSRIFLCCLFACWLCTARPNQACAQTGQTAPADEAWPFQFDLFQLLLEERGLVEMADFDEAFSMPTDAVIVLANPTPQASVPWVALHQFVQEGGTILLAAEQPMRPVGIGQFMMGPVRATEPSARYGVFDDCVQVTDISNVDRLFNGIFTVVTNRSTWFLPDPRGPFEWSSIARFPRNSLPYASRGEPLLALGRPTAGGAGIIIVSADASLFTNGMLWHGDNTLLAIRIAAALCEGNRKRLVFMADGQVLGNAKQRFQKPENAGHPNLGANPPLPEPRLSQFLKLANAVAKEVADSNVINESLKQRPRNVRPARYFRALLVVLTVSLLMWLLYKLLTRRPLRPTLLRRRRMRSAHELGTTNGHEPHDYRQSASYLAREFCWQLTGSRHSTDWQKYAARLLAASPSLDGFEQRELTRIIDIASRGCREPISSAAFQQLGRTIAILRAKYTPAVTETMRAPAPTAT